MDTPIAQALACLQAGRGFVWTVITDRQGSAPRGRGARMLVLPEGQCGSLGGGALEARVLALARAQGLMPHLEEFQLSGGEPGVSGSLCGGRCQVLLAPVSATGQALAVFQTAAEAERTGRQAWFVYILSEVAGAPAFQLLLGTQEGLLGQVRGDQALRRLAAGTPGQIDLHGGSLPSWRCLADPIQSGGQLFLFGGGHVSLETARLAQRVEFQVVVVDDRPEFANPARFPGCMTFLTEGFRDLDRLQVGPEDSLVIVTRDHVWDQTVLAWALGKQAAYLGMMGSRAKRDAVYAALRRAGYDGQALEAVHCPVGLSIGAQTPAEIAVSIVAQLIQSRAQRRRSGI